MPLAVHTKATSIVDQNAPRRADGSAHSCLTFGEEFPQHQLQRPFAGCLLQIRLASAGVLSIQKCFVKDTLDRAPALRGRHLSGHVAGNAFPEVGAVTGIQFVIGAAEDVDVIHGGFSTGGLFAPTPPVVGIRFARSTTGRRHTVKPLCRLLLYGSNWP